MFFLTRRRVRPLLAGALRGGAIYVLVSGFLRCFLAAPDRLLGALAGARVGLGALAVRRQPAAVADAAIGADLLEALDRLRALAAQIPLHLEVRVDEVAELRDLGVGEISDLLVGREAELRAHLPSLRGPDAEDV